MISSLVLRAMLSAGATAEMIVVAVEADNLAELDREVAAEAKLEDRRTANRERMRAFRAAHKHARTRTTLHNDAQRAQKEKVSHTLPKENNLPKESIPKGIPKKGFHDALPENPFELFWQKYPRKVGKGTARSAYRSALKRASVEEIAAGLNRYLASKPERQFTKHPKT